MRFAVVFACLLAAAAAQLNNGQYSFQREPYNQYNSKYNGQYNNQYNGKLIGQYNNQYNGKFIGQYNNPYNRNQNNAFKPFVYSTPSPPRSVVVAHASAGVAPPLPAPLIARPPVVPVAAAKISADARSAEILRYGNDISPDGSYNYFYETSNGIAAQEQGVPRNFGGSPPLVSDVAQGSFSWISPEGENIAITYVADENGYQPSGSAIPVAPEIPPQIARALQYIAKNYPLSKNN